MNKKLKIRVKGDGYEREFAKVEYIQNDFVGVIGIYCYKKVTDKDWSLYVPIISLDYVAHE